MRTCGTRTLLEWPPTDHPPPIPTANRILHLLTYTRHKPTISQPNSPLSGLVTHPTAFSSFYSVELLYTIFCHHFDIYSVDVLWFQKPTHHSQTIYVGDKRALR